MATGASGGNHRAEHLQQVAAGTCLDSRRLHRRPQPMARSRNQPMALVRYQPMAMPMARGRPMHRAVPRRVKTSRSSAGGEKEEEDYTAQDQKEV